MVCRSCHLHAPCWAHLDQYRSSVVPGGDFVADQNPSRQKPAQIHFDSSQIHLTVTKHFWVGHCDVISTLRRGAMCDCVGIEAAEARETFVISQIGHWKTS
jgi:hypothetical protein